MARGTRHKRGIDVRVRTWRELHNALYEGTWDEDIGRFRPQRAYRGIGIAQAELSTALIRLGGDYARHERNLLRNFRKYARVNGRLDSMWDWLALAQHHGLPTRLLDWTFSPNVAMHFATANTVRAGEDGIIWCVDYGITNRYLPPLLREMLEEEDAQVFSADMLARAVGTLERFDMLARRPFVAFFEPPSLDERIVNQFALFSLMSTPSGRLDRWLESLDTPGVVRRIIIPAELKLEVRDKLDQANVTERVLFPGLDGLCQWLRRYYSPGQVPPDLRPGQVEADGGALGPLPRAAVDRATDRRLSVAAKRRGESEMEKKVAHAEASKALRGERRTSVAAKGARATRRTARRRPSGRPSR